MKGEDHNSLVRATGQENQDPAFQICFLIDARHLADLSFPPTEGS